MTDYIRLALEMGFKAHAGQKRWGGESYFSAHCVKVGIAAGKEGGDDARIVGYLHDILEDTETSVADLGDVFPPRIVSAVVAMTIIPGDEFGDTYGEYMERLIRNPLALLVKKHDIEHNLSTLNEGDPRQHRQRRHRYTVGLALLKLADAVHKAKRADLIENLETT